MNRVTHLFVAKNVATGNEGHVRAVSKDGTTRLGDTDTIATDPYIYIEQEIAGGAKIYSPPIYGQYVQGWTGTSYTAPTAQVDFVGNIGSGTLDIVTSNDTEYKLYITLKSDKDGKTIPWSYKYTSSSSATSQEIADAFVAAVNASPYLNNDYSSITAATVNNASDYGFSLTGGTGSLFTSFETSVGGGFEDTTITNSAVADPGSGSSVWASELEKSIAGYLGYTNQRMQWGDKFNTPPAYVVDGATYDVYVIDYGRKHDEEYIATHKVAPLQIIVLVPAGATTLPQSGAGSWEINMNSWMASTPGAFPSVAL